MLRVCSGVRRAAATRTRHEAADLAVLVQRIAQPVRPDPHLGRGIERPQWTVHPLVTAAFTLGASGVRHRDWKGGIARVHVRSAQGRRGVDHIDDRPLVICLDRAGSPLADTSGPGETSWSLDRGIGGQRLEPANRPRT